MVRLLENVIVFNQNFSHNVDPRSSTSSVYLIKTCFFFSSIFPLSLGAEI